MPLRVRVPVTEDTLVKNLCSIVCSGPSVFWPGYSECVPSESRKKPGDCAILFASSAARDGAQEIVQRRVSKTPAIRAVVFFRSSCMRISLQEQTCDDGTIGILAPASELRSKAPQRACLRSPAQP